MSSAQSVTSNTLVTEVPNQSGLKPDKLSRKIEQTPLSVSFYTSAITSVGLGLFLSQYLEYVGLVFVVLIPIVLYIHHDFQNYLNLGPGGTPSTFKGYLRIAWLHLWALRDPFAAPKRRPGPMPDTGILHRRPLPYRTGPRPRVVGIAPHRQIDQNGSHRAFEALGRALEKLASNNPDKFTTDQSFIEKHGLALFGQQPLQTRWKGEITHLHDSDYAMHMALHPQDIEHILERGWGQRHPLGWEDRFWTMPVSGYFTMIYASRDQKELEIISRIIEAGIWYTLGEEVALTEYLSF